VNSQSNDVGVANDPPRFSIVVPAYQAEDTLHETLDAIVGQTFGDWECIVVDDGSTDHTLGIASDYARANSRIRVVHQDNQGTAGAYNAGVSAATGDYIVICSADDILLPNHLERMSAFIDNEGGYDIYTANGYRWSGGPPRELMNEQSPGEKPSSLELADVIRACFFAVGAAYRRQLFAKVGGYRRDVFGEDYDFWLRALAMGARHRYLPVSLSLFRVSSTQKSARLRTVYESDIRLVTDLKRDFMLTPWEDHVVEESIRERRRLIAELGRRKSLYRAVGRPVARRILFGLLGRQRAQRWWRSVRSGIFRLKHA
jgi:glycosyltransferase involved in cell wall biosynthesis